MSALDEIRDRYESADGRARVLALFDAIQYCAVKQIPLPMWAALELQDMIDPWASLEVATLDEAFGVKPVKRRADALNRLKSLDHVVARVNEAREHGTPIDEQLFDAIGREVHASGGAVRKWYYEESHAYKRLKNK